MELTRRKRAQLRFVRLLAVFSTVCVAATLYYRSLLTPVVADYTQGGPPIPNTAVAVPPPVVAIPFPTPQPTPTPRWRAATARQLVSKIRLGMKRRDLERLLGKPDLENTPPLPEPDHDYPWHIYRCIQHFYSCRDESLLIEYSPAKYEADEKVKGIFARGILIGQVNP